MTFAKIIEGMSKRKRLYGGVPDIKAPRNRQVTITALKPVPVLTRIGYHSTGMFYNKDNSCARRT